jgi:3',5'-cyclic AMP phosphodiesterase CpdA
VTRIWLLSDLHQEFVRDPVYGAHPLTSFDPAIAAPPDFDIVVLAGDIDVPLARSITWAADRFAGVPVVYVPGNHDFGRTRVLSNPRGYAFTDRQRRRVFDPALVVEVPSA